MSPPPPQEPTSVLLSTTTKDNASSTVDNKFTLNDLIKSIHDVLGDEGLDSERIDPQRIIELMERYSSNAADWNKYTLFDHSRAYTRNLVDDGNGKFNLMILAWSKGQKSPIHDHAGSHCVMKVLDGELEETLFHWPSTSADNDDNNQPVFMDITANESSKSGSSLSNTNTIQQQQQPLTVLKDTIYQPNQVTYVHDKIGLHRISNPNKECGAVSLHLYTPPYKMCKTFEENTGRARSSGICSFYSIGGNRV